MNDYARFLVFLCKNFIRFHFLMKMNFYRTKDFQVFYKSSNNISNNQNCHGTTIVDISLVLAAKLMASLTIFPHQTLEIKIAIGDEAKILKHAALLTLIQETIWLLIQTNKGYKHNSKGRKNPLHLFPPPPSPPYSKQHDAWNIL